MLKKSVIVSITAMVILGLAELIILTISGTLPDVFDAVYFIAVCSSVSGFVLGVITAFIINNKISLKVG